VIPVAQALSATVPLKDIQHYMRPGTLRLPVLPPLSLYVHLPWCLRKCPYCDFNSHEFRAGGEAGELPEQRYIDALVADLEASLPLVWGRPVHSIFIGGGTPSLFSPQAIDRLLGDIRARLPLTPDCEITLEANPGTFEKDRFKAFRTAGVTRLSVGVQSFNDAHLSALGRVHDRAQALAAVEEAAQAFDTFNLDLMYALPGQTLAELDEDIHTALALGPPHISIYHLTIEPNTVFAKYPPAVPEDDAGLRHARPPDRADGCRGAAALRGLCLCPARTSLLAQPQLLAVRRLPGDWRGRAQQAQLCRTARCARCVTASPSATWTARWRGRL
jgi:coproporphyrinogen III oxidase-like Fe-S oxidoreductase